MGVLSDAVRGQLFLCRGESPDGGGASPHRGSCDRDHPRPPPPDMPGRGRRQCPGGETPGLRKTGCGSSAATSRGWLPSGHQILLRNLPVQHLQDRHQMPPRLPAHSPALQISETPRQHGSMAAGSSPPCMRRISIAHLIPQKGLYPVQRLRRRRLDADHRCGQPCRLQCRPERCDKHAPAGVFGPGPGGVYPAAGGAVHTTMPSTANPCFWYS